MTFDLNDDNFLIYAAKHYDSPHFLTSEFEEDIKRFTYIKRLFKKYRQTNDFNERLITNHVIILSNVFGVQPTVNMLFFKTDPEDYPSLKTILIFLNYMPEHLKVTFNKYYLIQEEIPVDLKLADKLREI